MNTISIFILILLTANCALGQSVISEKVSIHVSEGVSIKIPDNLKVSNSGVLTNKGVIDVKKDAEFDGSSEYNGLGKIRMTGTSGMQFLTLNDTVNILEIRNSDGLELNENLSISSILDLAEGKVFCGSSSVSVLEDANVSNYSTDKYVVTNSTGVLEFVTQQSKSYFVPIGNSSFNPIKANVNSSSRIGYGVADTGNSTYKSVERTWNINNNDNVEQNLSLSFYWLASDEEEGFESEDLFLLSFNDSDTTQIESSKSEDGVQFFSNEESINVGDNLKVNIVNISEQFTELECFKPFPNPTKGVLNIVQPNSLSILGKTTIKVYNTRYYHDWFCM
jgi:hypothetical protein